MIPNLFQRHHTALQEAFAAMIIIIEKKPRGSIINKAGRRNLHVADIRAHFCPCLAEVRGLQLELTALRAVVADFATGDGDDPSVAKIDAALFRRPIGLRQIGLHDVLLPRLAVVRADERAPRVFRKVAITPCEPEAHQPNCRHMNDIRNLHRHWIWPQRGDFLKVDAIGGTIQIMLPIRADAAHPKQHRAVFVKPFANGAFAVVRRVDNR